VNTPQMVRPVHIQ